MSSLNFCDFLAAKGLDFQAKSESIQHQLSDTCVKKYQNLVKGQDKQIELWLDSKGGLSASIGFLNEKGEPVNKLTHLKLEGLSPGLPKKIVSQEEKRILTKYLEKTHATAERSLNGTYNRVYIHISAKGGGRTKIPFQPGLALGSVVRGSSLEKMEEYSEAMAKKQILEEQIQTAEDEIDLLEEKINTRKEQRHLDEKSSEKDPLIKNWKKQIESCNDLIDDVSKEMGDKKVPIPFFVGFQQALESPIDMSKSHYDIQPRGFDSQEFSSQYIAISEDRSEIHNKMNQSASANSLSLGGGGGFGLWKGSAKVSHSWAKGAAERVAQLQKEGKAKGILVMNSFVTTRHVRCFQEVKWDYSKLENILQAMESPNTTPEQLERYGITVSGEKDKTTKEIYLLTEAVLGGAFTALVTFLDTSESERDAKAESKESSSTTSASGKIGFGLWNAKGGFSRSSSNALESEDDVLENISNTKVNIQMFSDGVIPTFGRNPIEHEVLRFLDSNPSKHELSKKEESDVEAFVKAKGVDKEIAIAKQELKLIKNQEAFVNNYRALTSEKSKQNIHTLESVMSAFESFSKKITDDKECGVPVGFNYRILTQNNIKELVKEHKNSLKENETDKKEGEKPQEKETGKEEKTKKSCRSGIDDDDQVT